jgi:hypothetical protein
MYEQVGITSALREHGLTDQTRPTVPSRIRANAAPAVLPCQCFGLGVVLAAVLGIEASASESHFKPYAQSNFYYDSNIFRVDSAANVPVDNGQQVRDDLYIANTLGADATYEYGLQQFHAKVEGRRYDYLELSRLNHFEYTVNGGMNYRILDRLGGTINYDESRRQSVFEDRNTGQLSNQLNFDRDRNGSVTSKFLVVQDWTLDGAYRLHELKTPVIGAPSLKLTDNTANVGLNYIGISRLSVGLLGTYQVGNYANTPNATNFKQYNGSGVITYNATEISRFNLTVGYTRREDSGFPSTPGFTGNFGYQRELTAKTKVLLRAFRGIISYDAGDNTVVETSGGAGINWAATEKVSLAAAFDYVNDKFRNQGLPGSFNQNRVDKIQTESLSANYAVQDWLQASLTTSYETRHSTVQIDQFNSAAISFTLKATLP